MSDHSSYDNVQKSEEVINDPQPPPPPQAINFLPLKQQQDASTATSPRLNSMTTNNVGTARQPEEELSEGRENLHRWLGRSFRVVITDGRVLVGFFNCTDKDANIVLSMCAEYLEEGKDARILGNVMIPGKHIVSISVDMPQEEAFARKKQEAIELKQ